ncbi:sensor histidine kinase [Nocardioides mangrovi]|uniref:sensor histidine kinase n=1 Tax=Nocardioides mangrovi TaxID=2874580 RepID=UPI001CC53271|nr:HAMP domain-containing sensor histidine kinase [Nocardioides mangrovi]
MLPVLLAPLLAPDLRSWEGLADVSRISTLLIVLAADLLFYIAWRATGGPIGWLTLGLTALSLDALTLAAMMVTDSDALETHRAWATLVQIANAVGVLVLVALARRRTLRVDPLVAGIGIGLAATLTRAALVGIMPSMGLSDRQADLLQLVNLLMALLVAVGLFRLASQAAWAPWRITIAWVLLSLGHTAAYLASPPFLLTVVTIVTDILGAALIVSVAAALAWVALQDQRETLRRTRHELELVQMSVRDDAARLHEMRATVAGLTSAAQLIRREDLPEDRRDSIESMMESEMDRLQRLLQGSPSSEPTSLVDLDSTIEPLVVRHQLRGSKVRWRPTGERVSARRDDVAEVINVLLENAFQHAAGAGAWIYTRHIDGHVEVAVADAGPGVDQSVRPHIFEWGERSKSSGGSGIGLNVAQQLTVELGGYLRLVDSPALGATFVLGLPAEDAP